MQAVVGAAIVRHSCVLAARRMTPAPAAGRWEFPGGKVEPGEAPEAALVREVVEELGCRIEVIGWLSGETRIDNTHVLRIAVAALVEGEPDPVEHDAVRWLGPEELDDVDWLEPDRPFLAELREKLLDGEELSGGNVGVVVRVGETVRRPTGAWTPAVHAFLNRARRLPGVPHVHGIDARGREVLDFLPGEVIDVDTDLLSEARLAALGRWTRQFHRAVEGFAHRGPWRFSEVGPSEVVAHNDLAPYNVCFDGDEVAGVFDWDFAGPSTVLHELGQIAWNAIPLFREIPTLEAARRLGVLATSYDGPTAREVLAAVEPRVQLAIDGIRTGLTRGERGLSGLQAAGEPERTERALASFRARRSPIEVALSRCVGGCH